MKTYGEMDVQLQIFLTLAIDSNQLHGPAALPKGKKFLYPVSRSLGEPQIQSVPGGEKKKALPRPFRCIILEHIQAD
jgi:hypothetical protein